MSAVHAKPTALATIMVFALHWSTVEAGIHLGSSLRGLAHRAIRKDEVAKQLKTSLDAVVLGGDESNVRQMMRIEGALWHSFQAVPKYRSGRAAPRAVRHLVRTYFAAEHGWLLSGLEPHGMHPNVSVEQKRKPKLDPEFNGRVPLSTCYSQPNTALYQFVESVDYLREVGTLEELSVGDPSVRIANYILSPTNCIATSSFFSVCCLCDCGQLTGEVEHMVHAPAASPEILLAMVGNLSLIHSDGEHVVSSELEAKLHSIAAVHAGTVPLHGRLLAQWMHFGFPLECPYPHVLQDSRSLSPASWTSKNSYTSTEEQRQQFIEQSAIIADKDINTLAVHWTDNQVMPLQEPYEARRFFGAVVRGSVQLVILAMVLKIASAGMAAVSRVGHVYDKAEKELQDVGMAPACSGRPWPAAVF